MTARSEDSSYFRNDNNSRLFFLLHATLFPSANSRRCAVISFMVSMSGFLLHNFNLGTFHGRPAVLWPGMVFPPQAQLWHLSTQRPEAAACRSLKIQFLSHGTVSQFHSSPIIKQMYFENKENVKKATNNKNLIC